VYDGATRLLAEQRDRFRRGGPAAIAWALRLTVAAVAGYVVASGLFPHTKPLLAPLTALLVVQVTPVSLLASGLDRVVSVVSGVGLAVAFSAVVPLAWWSLGVLIAVSIMIGQALRLRSNLIEVAISAMLVLGVGALGAEAAAWQRITETLVGAAVGIATNLLFPPAVGTEGAGRAIEQLADALSGLLTRAADELVQPDVRDREVAARAKGWLEEARRVTHDIPPVGAALLRAEQGRRLNVRAVGSPDVGPGLRQGLEALEHTAVAIRSLFRAVHDATYDTAWPEGEVAEAVTGALEQVFREMAAGIEAFGDLVRAEAHPEQSDLAPEVHRVEAALEGLHEARARVSDLLLVDLDPPLAELSVTVLATVKRLLTELSLGERLRRQVRLRSRVSRTRPGRVASATARPARERRRRR